MLPVLRHDALETELAGACEDGGAGALRVLDKMDPDGGFLQQLRQRDLARLERQRLAGLRAGAHFDRAACSYSAQWSQQKNVPSFSSPALRTLLAAIEVEGIGVHQNRAHEIRKDLAA